MLEKKLRFTPSATNALVVFYQQIFGEFFWKRKLFADVPLPHPWLEGGQRKHVPQLFYSRSKLIELKQMTFFREQHIGQQWQQKLNEMLGR